MTSDPQVDFSDFEKIYSRIWGFSNLPKGRQLVLLDQILNFWFKNGPTAQGSFLTGLDWSFLGRSDDRPCLVIFRMCAKRSCRRPVVTDPWATGPFLRPQKVRSFFAHVREFDPSIGLGVFFFWRKILQWRRISSWKNFHHYDEFFTMKNFHHEKIFIMMMNFSSWWILQKEKYAHIVLQ